MKPFENHINDILFGIRNQLYIQYLPYSDKTNIERIHQMPDMCHLVCIGESECEVHLPPIFDSTEPVMFRISLVNDHKLYIVNDDLDYAEFCDVMGYDKGEIVINDGFKQTMHEIIACFIARAKILITGDKTLKQ